MICSLQKSVGKKKKKKKKKGISAREGSRLRGYNFPGFCSTITLVPTGTPAH